MMMRLISSWTELHCVSGTYTLGENGLINRHVGFARGERGFGSGAPYRIVEVGRAVSVGGQAVSVMSRVSLWRATTRIESEAGCRERRT
jgi:hypothetical protein